MSTPSPHPRQCPPRSVARPPGSGAVCGMVPLTRFTLPRGSPPRRVMPGRPASPRRRHSAVEQRTFSGLMWRCWLPTPCMKSRRQAQLLHAALRCPPGACGPEERGRRAAQGREQVPGPPPSTPRPARPPSARPARPLSSQSPPPSRPLLPIPPPTAPSFPSPPPPSIPAPSLPIPAPRPALSFPSPPPPRPSTRTPCRGPFPGQIRGHAATASLSPALGIPAPSLAPRFSDTPRTFPTFSPSTCTERLLWAKYTGLIRTPIRHGLLYAHLT